MKSVYTFFNRHTLIKKQVKKNKSIIYGARSMNRQLTYGFLERPTQDWDIYSKKPKRSARELERTLDFHSGRDVYFSQPSKYHKNTHKVFHKGGDMRKGTMDDIGIADYSKTPRGLKIVRKNGLRYSHLNNTIRDKHKALRDPQFRFRWRKDKEDLNTIRVSNRLRKIKHI